jgi:hypothetical protein
MNEVAFELATPSNYVEECPGCDAMLAYNKKDYFLSNFRQVLKKVREVTCVIITLKQLLDQLTYWFSVLWILSNQKNCGALIVIVQKLCAFMTIAHNIVICVSELRK